MLFPDKKIEDVLDLAEGLRNNVAGATLNYQGSTIQTTISLGMTCCIPKVGQSSDTLVSQADIALYEAKNGGRNRVVVKTGDNCSEQQ